MRRITILISIVLMCGFLIGQEVKRVPAKYTSPVSGAEMYKSYCASCHGLDMKGTGPAAKALKDHVPDLTQLSKKNANKFPSDHVSQMILGESLVAAHGSRGMPVWGPAFVAMDQGDRAVVRLRAKNLAQHIEQAQMK